MDGQGRINNNTIRSMLTLSNVIMIHFHYQDLDDEISVEELFELVKMIHDFDNPMVCYQGKWKRNMVPLFWKYESRKQIFSRC